MNMKIAVFVGSDGQTIGFNEAGKVKVYIKDEEGWQVVKEIPFEINNLASTMAILENFRIMVESLDECKVFVAAEVKGLPYTILEGMRFNIWKTSGIPEDFLEYIFEKEEQSKLEKLNSKSIPAPVEVEEGKYFIDLKAVMESNEKVTSKQVLLPFFQNTAFKELEVICTHVPPWFNVEFQKLNFKTQVKAIDEGGFKVKVFSADLPLWVQV